jgi:hypothetical protein
MEAVHIARASDEEQVFSAAVVVGPQVWADSFRSSDKVATGNDPVSEALARLEEVLSCSGSSMAGIAKLDAYVTGPELAERIREVHRATFAAPRPVLQVQVVRVWGPDPVLLDAVAAVQA